MRNSAFYYLSRLVLVTALAVLIWLMGGPWWLALLLGGLAMAFFLWAPHSGWYVARFAGGAAPLRRDERGQAVVDRAARYAFAATMLALGGLALYFGAIAPGNVPVPFLGTVLCLGTLVYFGTSLWLRRL